jgi:fructose-bisphosphate aldolase/2-amino-3,7-dideoxy-D-threo-hept-6-ulosonate synthase
MLGKTIRLRRIFDQKTGKTVIVPMDHGVSLGPGRGLTDMRATVDRIAEGGASAIVIHKGLVPHVGPSVGSRLGLIVHISASTSRSLDPNHKVLVSDADTAAALGADAISIHCNIGGENEEAMISDFGAVSDRCMELGLPLLAMVYPRGRNVQNSFDVDLVKHSARLAAELGADVVKTNYTGAVDSFREVVRGTPIPVVIAGGPKAKSDLDVLKMVQEAVEAGAKGVSIGRNVFEHDDIAHMTSAIGKVVFQGMSYEEAYRR